jgi:hypothetical protein
MPTTVAETSNAWVCGQSLVGIEVNHSSVDMDASTF